jgi:hypothetical protein
MRFLGILLFGHCTVTSGVVQLGGTLSDRAVSVSVSPDDDGLIYTVGTTSSAFTCGATHIGANDVLVFLTNELGEVSWVKQFGTEAADEGLGISAVSGGGAVLVGVTAGSFSTEIGEGLRGHSDYFLMRISQNGDPMWVRQFDRMDGAEEAAGVFIAAGAVHVAGTLATDDEDKQHAFLARHDLSTGDRIWLSTVDGNGAASGSELGKAVAATADGSAIYLGGMTSTPSGLHGQSYMGGSSDTFVSKFNADGERLFFF